MFKHTSWLHIFSPILLLLGGVAVLLTAGFLADRAAASARSTPASLSSYCAANPEAQVGQIMELTSKATSPLLDCSSSGVSFLCWGECTPKLARPNGTMFPQGFVISGEPLVTKAALEYPVEFGADQPLAWMQNLTQPVRDLAVEQSLFETTVAQ